MQNFCKKHAVSMTPHASFMPCQWPRMHRACGVIDTACFLKILLWTVCLYTPQARTAHTEKLPFFALPKMWNNLTDQKHTPNPVTFKILMKNHLLNQNVWFPIVHFYTKCLYLLLITYCLLFTCYHCYTWPIAVIFVTRYCYSLLLLVACYDCHSCLLIIYC
jgi:hypothetical protein